MLHTRPADNNSGASSSENGEEKAKGKSKGLSASTLAAPRLIAVVEKIKRAHPGTLHQYTQSGLLAPVDEERPGLERVLAGKTK